MRVTFRLVGDYEDVAVSEAAREIGTCNIVMCNIGDFKNSSIPATSPTGF